MKIKNLAKPIAAMLSLALIISAFPLGKLGFISQRSAAAPNTQNVAMKIDNDKINKEKAYLNYETENAQIYVWLTNIISDTEASRKYQVDVFTDIKNNGPYHYEETISDQFQILETKNIGEALSVNQADNQLTVDLKDDFDTTNASEVDFCFSYVIVPKTDESIADAVFSHAQVGEQNQAYRINDGVFSNTGLKVNITDKISTNITLENSNGTVTANLYSREIKEGNNKLDLSNTEPNEVFEFMANSGWEKINSKETESISFSFDEKILSDKEYAIVVKDALNFVSWETFKTDKENAPVSAAAFSAAKSANVIRPTNDLNQYGDATNIVIQKLTNINNTGNTALNNAEVVVPLATTNNKGEIINLNLQSFSTGTYENPVSDGQVDIYYQTNITSAWRTAGKYAAGNTESKVISVTDLHLSNGEQVTALKYDFGTIEPGFKVYKAPEIKSQFSYTGNTEAFTFQNTAVFSADEISDIASTETIQAENPMVKVTVLYKDIDTNEIIPYKDAYSQYGDWETIEKQIPVYSKFSNLGRVNIPNYTIPASEADVHPTNAINYDASTFSGYAGESDVLIIHNYKALRADILTPNIKSKYDTLYTNDRNAFYFDSLGSKFEEVTNSGNTTLDSYNVNLKVPEEMSVNELVTPVFNNGDTVNMTVFYKTNQNTNWRQEDIALSASDMHTITFQLKDNEKITEAEMRFSSENGTIPVNFYSLNRGILKGVVSHDKTSAFSVTGTVTSSAQYSVMELDTGKTTQKTLTKSNSVSVNVIVPQLIQMTDNAAARLQAGDRFNYILNSIVADGNVALKDYTITDTLSDSITVSTLQTGIFSGVIDSTYKIVITKADGTKIEETCNTATGRTIDINAVVKSITYVFPAVGKTFEASAAPVINASVNADVKNGSTFQNKVDISAMWTSINESDSNNQLSDSFTTTTKIVKAEINKPSIDVASELFNKQKAEYKINNVGNKGNTEIYDFAVLFNVPNDTVLNAVSTGIWKNTAWSGNALTIQYKENTGSWVDLKTITDFTVDENILLPENNDIQSIRYLFKVAPLGFTSVSSPKITVSVNTGLKNDYVIAANAAVSGVFGPTAEMDTTTIPDTSLFKSVSAQSAAASSKIVVPKISKVSLNAPESNRFDRDLKYTIENFKNEGKTYLYNVDLVFDLSEKVDLNALTTGIWANAKLYSIYYQKGITELITDENGEERTEYKIGDWEILQKDVTPSTNHTVSLPELKENEQIAAVKFVFGTVEQGFEMKDSPELVTEIKDNVEPNEEIPIVLNYHAVGGYAANPEEPTADEIADMPHDFSTELKENTSIIKPVLGIPALSVPTDTMKYREKFSYSVGNIKNAGNTDITDAYVINSMNRVRIISMVTPKFNTEGTYSVLYRTNLSADKWQVWENKVNRQEAKELFVPDLKENEYITDVILELGEIKQGFENTSDWKLNVINWSSAYDTDEVVNTVEINGSFNDVTLSSKNRVLFTPVLPELLKANIAKTVPEKAYPTMEYDFVYQNLVNNTEADIDSFTLSDVFTAEVQPVSVNTGVYTQNLNDGYLSVLYQTNKSGDGWYELIKKQSISENKTVEFPELEGEYITNVKFVYNTVNPGFKATEAPSVKTKFIALENHTEFTTAVSLSGLIDGKDYSENASYTIDVNYGWVDVELYDIDTGKKIGETGKYYGNIGENYQISDYPLKGYQIVKVEGNTAGTFADGYTDTVKAYYKALPKTGESPFLTWNFIAGTALLGVVGISLLCKGSKKKEKINGIN